LWRCGESYQDIANLNNPDLMAGHCQNFALLMMRLGSGTYDGIQGLIARAREPGCRQLHLQDRHCRTRLDTAVSLD
jgi:hypothetical protein